MAVLLLLFLHFIPLANGSGEAPLLDLELVQKNQSGPKYQVGDRIQFSVTLPLNLIHQISNIQIKYIDEKNTLDQLGLYLDPSPQVINGNLRFAVYPIKSGSITLPELTVVKDSDAIIGKTRSLSLDVAELNKTDEEPDFLDTVSISMPVRFVLLGLFLIAVLTALGIYLVRKARNHRVVTPVVEYIPPPIPDHEIALRELESLYIKYSYSPENLKPVAFGVSEILKKYFSSRFKIDAVESTTDEMIQLLKMESVTGPDISKIKLLFNDLDLIKFTDLIHHQHFQRFDFMGFKDSARIIISRWSNPQDGGVR